MGEKTYSVIQEAQQIVVDLCNAYSDELCAVSPHSIIVLGIENDPPEYKDWLARTCRIKGAVKTILELANSNAQYYIECYWDEWKSWDDTKRQWIMFHELLHIPLSGNGLVNHDVEDFAGIIDVLGPLWTGRSVLPDMLSGQKIAFKKELFVRLQATKKDKDAGEPPIVSSKPDLELL
jgi:hypothetical protein